MVKISEWTTGGGIYYLSKLGELDGLNRSRNRKSNIKNRYCSQKALRRWLHKKVTLLH